MNWVADPMETDADIKSEYGGDLNKPNERDFFEVKPLQPIQRRLVPAELSRHGPLTEVGSLTFLTELTDDGTH